MTERKAKNKAFKEKEKVSIEETKRKEKKMSFNERR